MRCRTENGRRRVREDHFRRDFISDYASTFLRGLCRDLHVLSEVPEIAGTL